MQQISSHSQVLEALKRFSHPASSSRLNKLSQQKAKLWLQNPIHSCDIGSNCTVTTELLQQICSQQCHEDQTLNCWKENSWSSFLRRQDFHHLIVFPFPLLLSLVLVENIYLFSMFYIHLMHISRLATMKMRTKEIDKWYDNNVV